MKNNNKVIPLFGNRPALENESAMGRERDEFIEPYYFANPPSHEMEKEWEEPREAGIGDWVMENCNALPVHEEEDGRVVVAVPIQTFDEMVCLVVDCVNDYENMKSALERIAGRGNELERKIAKDSLAELSTNQKNDIQ